MSRIWIIPGSDPSAMSDWHHGYAAGAILRTVALAYEEAADSRSDLPNFPEFAVYTELLRATSAAVADRAKNLSPTAYDVIVEICSGLLHSGRALIGTPIGSHRLDYLLCGIAYRQADWVEPLKRRKSWLGGAVRVSLDEGEGLARSQSPSHSTGAYHD